MTLYSISNKTKWNVLSNDDPNKSEDRSSISLWLWTAGWGFNGNGQHWKTLHLRCEVRVSPHINISHLAGVFEYQSGESEGEKSSQTFSHDEKPDLLSAAENALATS